MRISDWSSDVCSSYLAASLVAWLLRRVPIAPGLLAVSLLLFAHAVWIGREFHHPVALADRDAPAISILSFNILMSNEKNAHAITDAILSSGADLVNVMESEPLLGHLAALSSVYPYRLGCGVGTVQCDLMILSKRPLRSAGLSSLDRQSDG